jgi:hypothetical protein
MKFTSEDLMKAMGLVVGDRVKIDKTIYKVDYDLYSKDYYFKSLEIGRDDENLYCVIDLKLEFEILPRPKRVGDLKCGDFECNKCPLQFVCNLYDSPFSEDNSLYNILTKIDVYDQEIHDLLKDRLDKEVKEC